MEKDTWITYPEVEENIKMDVNGETYWSVDWTKLAEDKDLWRTVTPAMNFLVRWKVLNL